MQPREWWWEKLESGRRLDVDGAGWKWKEEELTLDPWTSEPCLGFGDVDLNAVRPFCGWVLSERCCSLGSHEASAGFLSLAVLKVQRSLSHHPTTPFGRPLRQRWGPLPLLRTQSVKSVKVMLHTKQWPTWCVTELELTEQLYLQSNM